ncbi:glycoside hydrolase family 76 protein [Nocardia sp. NPDC051570]|uniref:glycoside hydrolase family 76 protein n=1 Tax=Nocardia sp. NPDC051570 TaxID=3364324 RepID=UPI0037B3551F
MAGGRSRLVAVVLVLLAAVAVPSMVGMRPAAAQSAIGRPFLDWVSAGATTLDGWYDADTGLYRTTGWWNSAHALEAELTASVLRGDDRGIRRAATTYAVNQSSGFLNHYYDDEGWWALTWVRAFDITGDARYLQTARSLFDDLTGGWDQTCGGGVWWSKDRGYKNAVTNEIFIALGAELARHAEGADAASYRAWALRGWDWFTGSGMINGGRLVNDGLDAACHNNGGTVWSYNQGVVLGAAAGLYRLTGNPEFLRVARGIADAAIATLSGPDGILHESCEPSADRCGADGPQFKGIFIRNLAALRTVSPDLRYFGYIVNNAISIWTRSHGPGDEFGLVWSGPFHTGDAARQSSALACLNAAAQLG